MSRETSVMGTRQAVAMALSLLLGSTGAAALESIDKPRLKFRAKGPVCTCISNTGEKEIQAAFEARFSQHDDVSPPPAGERRTYRDEQRREVNEKQP